MTALERLRFLAGAHTSTGAALRSLVGAAGLAGALLVVASGLPSGSAAEHLLAVGTIEQPAPTETTSVITVVREPRVWAATAGSQRWATSTDPRAWQAGRVTATWAAAVHQRTWAQAPPRRLWVAHLGRTWQISEAPVNWLT